MNDRDLKAEIEAAGWPFPFDVWDCLTPYDLSFLGLEFTGVRTPEFYRGWIDALGFNGLGVVLDAGCGMGQWAICLSESNERVFGLDIDVGRILFARRFAETAGRSNCTFRYGMMEDLPLEDNSVDGVFCYGAFLYSDMPRTAAEFFRVLRPGGRIYITTSSLGCFVNLMVARGFKERNIANVKSAARMLTRTLLRRTRNSAVGERRLRRLISDGGFSVVGIGPIGGMESEALRMTERPGRPPERYYGLPARCELLGIKPVTDAT